MDRIREAVNRARDEQPAQAGSPGKNRPTASAHAPRPGQAPQAVECDRDICAEHRIISNEHDPVLNAYRVLRTRTLQMMEANNWRTIAVVSPTSGAGKTVTAINLAIAIGSKEGSRATLVDFDFYRPRVARYMGLDHPPSVLDYFEGSKSLHEVILHPDLSNTFVMANERVSRRGAEHLTSPKVDDVIDAALNKYQSRVVVFDVPPVLGCDDTIAFLPKVDCALLIAASGETRVRDVKEAQRMLGGVNLVGTVLNKAPAAVVNNAYY
ncbi:MAG: CpsD/CapB family tyrosine-protein kinase [Pseudomonadota bacterium]